MELKPLMIKIAILKLFLKLGTSQWEVLKMMDR